MELKMSAVILNKINVLEKNVSDINVAINKIISLLNSYVKTSDLVKSENSLLDDIKTINNVYENNDKVAIGIGDNNTFTVYGLSEKLIEQYEERIAELKEQVEFWKNHKEK